MDLLPKLFSHIKIVVPGDRIYKDECICSFDDAESDGGLYICMKTFQAVGENFLDYFYERYGHCVYLHHKRFRYRINKPESSEIKPKRLAIGLEGGFDPDASSKDYKVENTYSLLIMPQRTSIPLPNPELPELVLQSVESIISCESSDLQQPETNVWDGERRELSKHAESLKQIEPAPRIPPSNWKCEQCDLKENLWLNLTDGSILCGRKFYDGSGGNNHAVEHYEKCKHPLAVKLGTITANSADVYSYPEEDMVLDPYLDKHLAHFGIDIQKMTKTDKSMIELEIDMNEKLGEWSVIQEEGKELQPVAGPGFTGLANLGNSCYMNSVLQVLMSIDEFQQRYFPPIPIYNFCDGASDFNHQMAKLAYGLLSGKYSSLEQKGIQPKAFKHYVCGGDRNFSTKRQQDAHEFFLFLMDLIERNGRDGRSFAPENQSASSSSDPTKSLEFVIEDRIQCSQSKKVRYTHRVESCLSLHVDLNLAINKDEIEAAKATDLPKEIVRPKISLMSCIELFSKAETLSDFYSTAISAKTTAEKSSRIARFPRYFVFQMKKFQCGQDWVPKKIDVAFEVTDILDLQMLEGKGKQPEEEELEDSDQPAAGSTSSGEVSHLRAGSVEPDPEAMQNLLAMGIEVSQAVEALKVCNNNAERAIEYIFDPDSQASQQLAAQQASNKSSTRLTVATRPDPMKMKLFTTDTKPKLYQLKAFISHMGTSTMCGHYVCHIKKDNCWYIFNDNKVAKPEDPPLGFGYLYFYERVST